MNNVLKVLARDFNRLVHSRAALVVCIVMLVLPSLYTWYNVKGFWDPYSNTENLQVSVVNLDQGATSELTGQINVGDMVSQELEANQQLTWVITDYDTAMDQVMSGQSYAVFVIPEDFTENLLTITSGHFVKPSITYYVNEKSAPVAVKVTDTGSSTLEESINSTFVHTVAEVVLQAVSLTADEAQQAIDLRESQAMAKIQETYDAVSSARASLASAQTEVDEASGKVAEAYLALDAAEQGLVVASQDLQDVSSQASQAQQALVDATPQILGALSQAQEAMNRAAQAAQWLGYGEEFQVIVDEMDQCSTLLMQSVIPALGSGLGNLSSQSESLSVVMASQQTLIDQSRALLGQMEILLGSAQAALGQSDQMLASIQSDLELIQSDLATVAGAQTITALLGSGNLDVSAIADFMGSPTKVTTERLFPVDSMGAAMAPLFMNLTFWIGAFMLLVIMKQEVDDEGVPNLKVWQRYLARLLFFSGIAVGQAVVCCAGLLALGVRVASVSALFCVSILASLAYLNIIYALSVMFQHIGKGLCIVLVFLQIPSATGLYPIETTAPFYQLISPLFPFTYGIAGLREAICGCYGDKLFQCMAVLCLFMVGSLLVGITAGPRMSNVNRMFARKIGESGIYNGEDVEVPSRPFRLTQIIRVLADQEQFRQDLSERFERFQRMYPRLIRGAAVAFVLVPLVIVLLFKLSVGEKALLLSVWLVTLVMLFLFVVGVEEFRDSLARQTRLGAMDEGNLIGLYRQRHTVESADSPGEASCPAPDPAPPAPDPAPPAPADPAPDPESTPSSPEEGGEGRE